MQVLLGMKWFLELLIADMDMVLILFVFIRSLINHSLHAEPVNLIILTFNVLVFWTLV